MTIEQIIDICLIAIGAAGTIIGIVKGKKSSTKTKKLEKVVTFAQLVQRLPEIICKVERLLPSTSEVKFGEQKLELALKEVEMECLKNNVEYDEKAFTYEIEKILETPQKGVANEKTSDA